MNWPKYADHADYAEYAEDAGSYLIFVRDTTDMSV